MPGPLGSNDDREADRPARPPLTSKGLLGLVAVALIVVIGVLALLLHGVALPFAQHVEQVSEAKRQMAEVSPQTTESVASETALEILGPAEAEPPAQGFPAPEEFAKLLATDEPTQPSPAPAVVTPQPDAGAGTAVVAAPAPHKQPPPVVPEVDRPPPQAEVPTAEVAEDSEKATAPHEHTELEKPAEALHAEPDYWVGAAPQVQQASAARDRGDHLRPTDSVQAMALLEAAARGVQVAAPWPTQPQALEMTSPPAPWATQPPAPAMTQPPAPWATQPPAPAMTPPPAPWAHQPPAPAMTQPPAPWGTQPPAPAMTPPPAPWGTQPPAPAMTPPPAPWGTQPPFPAGSSPPSPGFTPPPGGSIFAQPPIGGTLNRGVQRQPRGRR